LALGLLVFGRHVEVCIFSRSSSLTLHSLVDFDWRRRETLVVTTFDSLFGNIGLIVHDLT
jgi:hypothetical protein